MEERNFFTIVVCLLYKLTKCHDLMPLGFLMAEFANTMRENQGICHKI